MTRQHMPARAGGWTVALLAGPGVLLLVMFMVVPFLMALGLSFTNQRLISNDAVPTAWVGLRNYLRLVDDEAFWAALGNNFLFVGIVAPLQSALALLLAVLVNRASASALNKWKSCGSGQMPFFGRGPSRPMTHSASSCVIGSSGRWMAA